MIRSKVGLCSSNCQAKAGQGANFPPFSHIYPPFPTFGWDLDGYLPLKQEAEEERGKAVQRSLASDPPLAFPHGQPSGESGAEQEESRIAVFHEVENRLAAHQQRPAVEHSLREYESLIAAPIKSIRKALISQPHGRCLKPC
jgi:hypothetical protein